MQIHELHMRERGIVARGVRKETMYLNPKPIYQLSPILSPQALKAHPDLQPFIKEEKNEGEDYPR